MSSDSGVRRTVVFAEDVTLGAVRFFVSHKKKIGRIVLFRKTRYGALMGFLRSLGLMGAAPEIVKTHLADVTDREGRCLFPEVFSDASRICEDVRRTEFEKSPTLNKACDLLGGRGGLLLYLEKCAFEDIFKAVAKSRIAKWHFERMGQPSSDCVLFLPDGPWWKHVSDYCQALGVRAVRMGAGPRPLICHFAQNNLFFPLFLIKRFVRGVLSPRRSAGRAEPAAISHKKALIATEYLGTPISLDLDRRSTFPWLVNSGVPEERVVLIRSNDAFQISGEERELLQKKGIRLLNISKASTLVRLLRDGKFLLPAFQLLASWAAGLLRPGEGYLADKLLMYLIFYRYWLDVFQRNRVKLIMTTAYCDPFHVPMNRALRDSNGISMSYQWSNIELRSKTLALSCYVYFGFSEMFREIFQRNGSIIGAFVPAGYVTDYTFKTVKGRAESLRRSLMDKGATFVITFFDENSMDDLYSIIPHQKNVLVYKYFLEKVLGDRTLGIIFKPSYPHTIYKRLAPISDLIERAKLTGRCLFLDKGQFKSDAMPSEAAQASDVVVGLLLSGTVALECALSGVKTVLLNLEKLPSWGITPQDTGSAVFETLDDLFAGIERFRDGKHPEKTFGDLSRWAALRDPHRDGKATVRIGRYVNALLDGLDRGEDRDTVLQNTGRACLAQPIGERVA
jgi:hypothetical protein